MLALLVLLPPAWFPFAGALKEHIGPLRSVNLQYFHRFIPFFTAIAGAYTLASLRDRSATLTLNESGRVLGISLMSVCVTVLVLCVGWLSLQRKAASAESWIRLGSYVANLDSPDLERLAGEHAKAPSRVATVNRPYKRELGVNYPMAYGLETADGYLTMNSRRYHDFWGRVVERALEQDRGLYQRFHNWGNRAALFVPGVHPVGEPIPFGRYFNLDLLSLSNTCEIISTVPLDDGRLTLVESQDLERPPPWAEMSRTEKIQARLTENFRGRRVLVYRNEGCFPRAFLVNRVREFESEERLLDALSTTDADTLRSTAFLHRALVENEAVVPGESRVEILDYSPDTIRLHVVTTAPGVLVLTTNFSPFWRVRVDGKGKAIAPAYHTFMSVYVPAGDHDVEFEYAPPYRLFSGVPE